MTRKQKGPFTTAMVERGRNKKPRMNSTMTRGGSHLEFEAPDAGSYYRANLSKLGHPKKESWVSGICPFHDDHNPSLSVNLNSGAFLCHACGAKGSNITTFHAKLHFQDDWHTARRDLTGRTMTMTNHSVPQEVKDATHRLMKPWLDRGYNPGGIYPYTPNFYRVRLDHPNPPHDPENPGKTLPSKIIRPISKNGAGWELKEPEFPDGKKPLYRREDVEANFSATVYVVEGEKCADALAQCGIVTVTSGSASSAGSADWTVLNGRNVIIWPDNDQAGTGYANAVTAILRRQGCIVHLIDVAQLNLPEGGDVVEWIEKYPHASKDDVQNLMTTESPVLVGQTSADWPEPKPIQAPLRPVPPFDPETLLPDVLRNWVIDEADRMPCPPDYIAVAVIEALGSIVGARCAIKPKSFDPWLIIPNLWGACVGQPAAKKSPAIDVALKPLGRLSALAMESHRAELEAYDAEKTVFEAKREAIESRIKAAARDTKKGNLDSLAKELQAHRQQKPKAPVQRRYKSNDTTVEKLGELLRDNSNGLLVMRDELVGLIASWDKAGREGERAFYLEAWNGDASFDTDRIGRGSIFIPNLCVSIFGGIQPDKLIGYLEQASNALANDGMLQRFQLLVYPDHRNWEWRDRIPDKEARDKVYALFETLADFDPVAWGATPADEFAKFPHFRFDDEAQQIFIEWSGEMHKERLPAEEISIIAQHLAKYDKLLPALALIFHLVECAATGKRGPVSADSVLRAAAFCEYLEAHARRCYGLLIDDGLRAAQALAKKVRQGKLSDGFTARDVRRNQWRYLTTDEAVEAALDWLEDEGWIRAEETGGMGPGTGRHTKRYSINPKLASDDQPGDDHVELD